MASGWDSGVWDGGDWDVSGIPSGVATITLLPPAASITILAPTATITILGGAVAIIAGTTIRTQCVFADTAGTVTAPGTVTCKAINPSTGASVSGTPVNTGTGTYYCEHELTVAGVWVVQWEATDGLDVVNSIDISVKRAY